MNNLLYIFAVVLLTVWMIGFFIYSLGAMVHVLLLLSLALVLLLSRRANKTA
ncbi:MAG: lmo0937 family membrane protein [Chryseolinea sp.]